MVGVKDVSERILVEMKPEYAPNSCRFHSSRAVSKAQFIVSGVRQMILNYTRHCSSVFRGNASICFCCSERHNCLTSTWNIKYDYFCFYTGTNN